MKAGGDVTAETLKDEIEGKMPAEEDVPMLLSMPAAFTPKYLEAELVASYHLG